MTIDFFSFETLTLYFHGLLCSCLYSILRPPSLSVPKSSSSAGRTRCWRVKAHVTLASRLSFKVIISCSTHWKSTCQITCYFCFNRPKSSASCSWWRLWNMCSKCKFEIVTISYINVYRGLHYVLHLSVVVACYYLISLMTIDFFSFETLTLYFHGLLWSCLHSNLRPPSLSVTLNFII